MDKDQERERHALEEEFGLPAREILDVINRCNRCKIAVRGAIAEAHLIKVLSDRKAAGEIADFEDFDIDGHPDLKVTAQGREFHLECKNVEKGSAQRVTVDFQRTRNPIDRPWERFYLPTEFDIVAACLWNSIRRWEFRFAATRDLPRHQKYPDRLSNRLVVSVAESELWTASLGRLLNRLLISRPPGAPETVEESEGGSPQDTPRSIQ